MDLVPRGENALDEEEAQGVAHMALLFLGTQTETIRDAVIAATGVDQAAARPEELRARQRNPAACTEEIPLLRAGPDTRRVALVVPV